MNPIMSVIIRFQCTTWNVNSYFVVYIFYNKGLEPFLRSCLDGVLILSASNLDFHLRTKLAGVVVNAVIQEKMKINGNL